LSGNCSPCFPIGIQNEKETRWDTEIKYTGYTLTATGESVLSAAVSTVTIEDETYNPKNPLSTKESPETFNDDLKASCIVARELQTCCNSENDAAAFELRDNQNIINNNNELQSCIKKYVATILTNGESHSTSHAETLQLCNSHDETTATDTLFENESHTELQMPCNSHDETTATDTLFENEGHTDVLGLDSDKDKISQVEIVRSSLTFFTSLKHSGTYNGEDCEYIKEELWRFLRQFYSREESFDLLDKLVQDKKNRGLN